MLTAKAAEWQGEKKPARLAQACRRWFLREGVQRIIPAPTVLLLLSSMTMKAPVARLSS